MRRSLCVFNNTGSPLNISVWLQATKSVVEVTAFFIDDWTFSISRHSPCSPTVNI